MAFMSKAVAVMTLRYHDYNSTDRRINGDVAKVYRGMKPEKELMRFACSMSRSIDHRRPWKLTPEKSASVNVKLVVWSSRRQSEMEHVSQSLSTRRKREEAATEAALS